MNKSRIEELVQESMALFGVGTLSVPDAIRAALTACAREAIEECAKVAQTLADEEAHGTHDPWYDGIIAGAEDCAAAIRKLKEGLE
jgi:hypothetical protein